MKNLRDNPLRKTMVEAWKELCEQQAIDIKFRSDGTSVLEDEGMLMYLTGYLLRTHRDYMEEEETK